MKKNGYFILTDYIVEKEEEELLYFSELERLKRENGINDSDFYHYDTPLTRKHETEALLAGGFSGVELLKRWGDTNILKACK